MVFARSLGGDRLGYMPLGRGYGFVDVGKHGGDEGRLLRTVAHELGHGAFGLEHLSSRFAHQGYGGGATDGLMEGVGEGTHLHKWEWDNCHSPEVKLPGTRDDGAGESRSEEEDYYPSWVEDRLGRAVSELACAAGAGMARVQLSLGSSDYPASTFGRYQEVELGGVAIEVQYPGPMEGPWCDPAPVSSEDGEGRMVLTFRAPTTAEVLRVRCAADDAEEVGRWFRAGDSPLAAAQRARVDELSAAEGSAFYSALATLADCAAAGFTAEERLRYVRLIAAERNVNDVQEGMIAQLLATAPEGQLVELYTLLATYEGYDDLLKAIDDPEHVRSVVGRLIEVFQAGNPAHAPAGKTAEELFAAAEGVETLIDFRAAESSRSFLRWGEPVEVAYEGGRLRFVSVERVMLSAEAPVTDVVKTDLATAGPMDAVVVFVGPGQGDLGLSSGQYLGVVPAAAAGLLAEKRIGDRQEQAAWLALDVALLATGAGEVRLAYEAYRKGRAAVALIRLSLAVADASSTIADGVCRGVDSEYCRAWEQYGAYVQLGLLTASAADGVGALLRRSADEVADAALTAAELAALEKLRRYGLLKNLGEATEQQVANVHRYTANGDYLNVPMRDPITNALVFEDVALGAENYQSYERIIEGLRRLRGTSRLARGEVVYRGRAVSAADFERLFGPGSDEVIPIKGFVSASRDRAVAEAFAANANFPGGKVRMIWNIKSRNGVDIDDISDWGSTLGPINHADADPAIIVQREVLMEEGYYRKLGEPRPIMENGVQKRDADKTLWFEVDLEELGRPIREITE